MANAKKKNTKAELEGLRLPELQGRFREVVGEMTRSPNRKFLVRRIEEALAAKKTEADVSTLPFPAEPEPQPETSALPSAAEPQPQPSALPSPAEPEPAATKPANTEAEEPQAEDAHDDVCLGCSLCLPAEPPAAEQTTAAAPAEAPRGRSSGMSVADLQALYLKVVGRPTGSDNTMYLTWKIREAEKGRITVGPVQPRKAEGTTSDADVMVLPLRLRTQVVTAMDAAWKANSIKSRMDFLRRAIGHYLVRLGADDAAALFAESK